MKILNLILFILSFSVFSSDLSFKFIKGEVSLNGSPVSSKSTPIVAPYIVTTGESSLAIIEYQNKMKFKVNKNSNIDLSKLLAKEIKSIELKKGSVFSSVQKKLMGKNKFFVKTENAALGVRGTEFFTALGVKSDLWMCVKSGLVEASFKDSKKVLVKAGEGISISSSGEISAPKPLPWTEKLNWNTEGTKNLENKIDIREAYSDLLDQDYD